MMTDLPSFVMWFFFDISPEISVLWLADTGTYLLLLVCRRGKIWPGNIWTALMENVALAVLVGAILPALHWPSPDAHLRTVSLVAALKFAISGISLAVQRATTQNIQSRLSLRDLVLLMFRTAAAVLAYEGLGQSNPAIALLGIPFLMLIIIDLITWLFWRQAQRGASLSLPLESAAIAIILPYLAAIVLPGGGRSSMLAFAFFLKSAVASLSLWMQHHLGSLPSPLFDRAMWAFVLLRAARCVLVAWVVLYLV